MTPFWITFEDNTKACCEGTNNHHAEIIAAHLTGKKVTNSQRLPYPAVPLIWQFNDPVTGSCPPFCYTPNECAGASCCRKNISCSE